MGLMKALITPHYSYLGQIHGERLFVRFRCSEMVLDLLCKRASSHTEVVAVRLPRTKSETFKDCHDKERFQIY